MIGWQNCRWLKISVALHAGTTEFRSLLHHIRQSPVSSDWSKFRHTGVRRCYVQKDLKMPRLYRYVFCHRRTTSQLNFWPSTHHSTNHSTDLTSRLRSCLVIGWKMCSISIWCLPRFSRVLISVIRKVRKPTLFWLSAIFQPITAQNIAIRSVNSRNFVVPSYACMSVLRKESTWSQLWICFNAYLDLIGYWAVW